MPFEPYQPYQSYQPVNNTGYPRVIEATTRNTAALLAKVLAITAAGFFVTAFGVATAPAWGMMVGIIAVFALVFAINFARRQSPAMALGLFFALAYFMGWEIAPIISMYLHAFGAGLVFQAALTTGLGMTAMACFAYLFQINYRRLAGIGMAALLALILTAIASIFFHFLSPGLYAWLTLGVFTLLTVADFARIRAGGQGQSAVVLAVSIYLDAINIFLAMLQILGMNGRRRD